MWLDKLQEWIAAHTDFDVLEDLDGFELRDDDR